MSEGKLAGHTEAAVGVEQIVLVPGVAYGQLSVSVCVGCCCWRSKVFEPISTCLIHIVSLPVFAAAPGALLVDGETLQA